MYDRGQAKAQPTYSVFAPRRGEWRFDLVLKWERPAAHYRAVAGLEAYCRSR